MIRQIPFGKYLLIERINVGGMAEVYKAKNIGVEGFERLLAIKRILPSIAEDDEFVRMFIDEAKISVQLTHANIAQIYDLGRINESYFIAMEYVSGKDLRSIYDLKCYQGSPLPVAMTCYIIAKACEGLDYAHRKTDHTGHNLEIVHRDVSPQNILISYDGEVKVIDFGIAKAANRASKTQAGILKGKFAYMSPEQVRGLPVDHRSDIFAIGICLFEMLTSDRLFYGDSDFSTLEKVRKAEVVPPSTFNPDVPKSLDKIVLKALKKDVSERYQWCSELGEDLQRFLISSDSICGRTDLSEHMKSLFPQEFEDEKESNRNALTLHSKGIKEDMASQIDRVFDPGQSFLEDGQGSADEEFVVTGVDHQSLEDVPDDHSFMSQMDDASTQIFDPTLHFDESILAAAEKNLRSSDDEQDEEVHDEESPYRDGFDRQKDDLKKKKIQYGQEDVFDQELLSNADFVESDLHFHEDTGSDYSEEEFTGKGLPYDESYGEGYSEEEFTASGNDELNFDIFESSSNEIYASDDERADSSGSSDQPALNSEGFIEEASIEDLLSDNSPEPAEKQYDPLRPPTMDDLMRVSTFGREEAPDEINRPSPYEDISGDEGHIPSDSSENLPSMIELMDDPLTIDIETDDRFPPDRVIREPTVDDLMDDPASLIMPAKEDISSGLPPPVKSSPPMRRSAEQKKKPLRKDNDPPPIDDIMDSLAANIRTPPKGTRPSRLSGSGRHSTYESSDIPPSAKAAQGSVPPPPPPEAHYYPDLQAEDMNSPADDFEIFDNTGQAIDKDADTFVADPVRTEAGVPEKPDVFESAFQDNSDFDEPVREVKAKSLSSRKTSGAGTRKKRKGFIYAAASIAVLAIAAGSGYYFWGKDYIEGLSRIPQGTIIVRGEPEGATVFVDGKAEGTVPFIMANAVVGARNIRVENELHIPHEEEINLDADQTVTIDVHLAPFEPASLIVLTDPVDSSIQFNDETVKEKGSEPWKMDDIPAGKEHTIIVEKEGFWPQNIQWTPEPAEQKELSVTLKKAETDLTFVSEPPRARVFLDGRFRGRTPLTLEGIDASQTYQLEIRLGNCYREWSSKLVLDERPEQTLSVTLDRILDCEVPSAALDTGTLRKEPEAKKIPERPVIPESGALRKEPEAKKIPDSSDIREEKAPDISQPRKAASATGHLSIDVRPGWAWVIIDGKETGLHTPLINYELPAGNYRVLLKAPDGRERLVDVRIKANENTRQRVDM